jgi:hypothetical protein
MEMKEDKKPSKKILKSCNFNFNVIFLIMFLNQMFCINKMKHNSLVDFSHYFMKENANIKNEKTNKNAYKIIMLNGSLVI